MSLTTWYTGILRPKLNMVESWVIHDYTSMMFYCLCFPLANIIVRWRFRSRNRDDCRANALSLFLICTFIWWKNLSLNKPPTTGDSIIKPNLHQFIYQLFLSGFVLNDSATALCQPLEMRTSRYVTLRTTILSTIKF